MGDLSCWVFDEEVGGGAVPGSSDSGRGDGEASEGRVSAAGWMRRIEAEEIARDDGLGWIVVWEAGALGRRELKLRWPQARQTRTAMTPVFMLDFPTVKSLRVLDGDVRELNEQVDGRCEY